MARGNLRGPLGPLMLAMLIGIALFMLFAIQSPELSAGFSRPDGFYDDTFEKVGIALAFAGALTVAVAIIRRLMR